MPFNGFPPEVARTILESISSGVIAFNRELEYTYWSRGMERLTGRAYTDVLHKKAVDVFPFLREQGIDKVYARALAGESVTTTITPYWIPGTEIAGWFIGHYAPHRDEQGEIIGVIGVVNDMTEFRARQEAELSQARMEIEIDMLKRFIGEVSHDLRHPLQTLKLNAYLLQRYLLAPEQHGEKINPTVNTLERQINYLSQFLVNMLDLALLDAAGTEQFEFSLLDLDQLVAEIAADNEVLFAERGLSFTLTRTAVPLFVIGDAIHLRMALDNLLSNALKYTLEGGVTIRVSEQDGMAVVEVTDTGIGMSQEDSAKVFERFYRAIQARQLDRAGAGLGLSIVDRIVRRHEGKISVTSKPGEGSKFTIQLPAKRP